MRGLDAELRCCLHPGSNASYDQYVHLLLQAAAKHAVKARLDPQEAVRYEEFDKWHSASKHSRGRGKQKMQMTAGACEAEIGTTVFMRQVLTPAGLGFSDVSSI
jgi:hypothetical protein